MNVVQRASGVLLHITSLPSDFGIGDFGPESYHFVDLLAQAKQQYWSILPLTPTSTQYGNSPYQPSSAFAGNTLLISPELLIKDGFLPKEDAKELMISIGRVDFEAVTSKKKVMLKKAYQNFTQNPKRTIVTKADFEKFCLENQNWLDEYSLYTSLRNETNKPWFKWPSQIRDRNAQSLKQKRLELKEQVLQEKFTQFLFAMQWNNLKNYCHKKGVYLIGDLPFYVAYDSSDVWIQPGLFKLDASKKPLYVGGVPPDYFSKTGQRWGNPVYEWREMKKKNFQWWMERYKRSLQMYDLLRLDHFRGYVAYWQIPACSKTAKEGKWIRVPSKSFFNILKTFFPSLPFIAEDLGLITNNVKKHLKHLELWGMRVLIFGFDGTNDNPNLPTNIIRNSIVYTGTHDTNTAKGWFIEEATQEQKKRFFESIGRIVSKNQISLELIKLALASKAKISIIPLQDILSLGSEARMNRPADEFHNWDWRLNKELLSNENFEKLAEITENSKRRKFPNLA